MAFLVQLGRSRQMQGYNFTEHVRRLLAMAREEAIRLHHEYVGTEHIVLGLVRLREGVAVTVLHNLGIDVDRIRRTIDATVKSGQPEGRPKADLPYTSRAKKVLELAMTEAREMHHTYVGSEHLLLGLLREERGIGAQVLVDAGLSLAAARQETLRLVGAGTQPIQLPPLPPAPEPPPPAPATPAVSVDRDREEIAWRRLHHALDISQRLGTRPTLSLVRDATGNRLTVSLGPDLTLTVEFPPDVEIGVKPTGEPPNA